MQHPHMTPTPSERLATIRTELAAERTLLAYVRTGLAVLVAGVGGYTLLDGVGLRWMSVMVALLGCFGLGAGLYRYKRVRARVRGLCHGAR